MLYRILKKVYHYIRNNRLGDLNNIIKNSKLADVLYSIHETLVSRQKDILDLSKISTGTVKLDRTSVDVDLVCQASLRLISELARKKRLKVTTMIDSAVTTIYADERRLKQVLVNLLNNAVKFTPEGGQIGLEVEGDFEKHLVDFTVWDTGIGIATEDLERLFQPFMQLDATLSRKYGGVGLGLTLVFQIVQMHGGSIAVESEVGKGSRFTVLLPWEKE